MPVIGWSVSLIDDEEERVSGLLSVEFKISSDGDGERGALDREEKKFDKNDIVSSIFFNILFS